MKSKNAESAIGATDELSLRVSVATLVRVVFKHPIRDELMLALERKATLLLTESGRVVEVKSQPFGGAIRILDVDAIHDLIGDFHFDSERSRYEQDFRIFIRPSTWSLLREFCIQHLSRVDDPILETDPARELTEEFADALKINLQPEQYVSKPVAIVVEDEAAPTVNVHAEDILTVRVYRIFEAVLSDSSLAQSMLKNSESLYNQDLQETALKDVRNGGKGRANAILAIPLKRITDRYLTLPPKDRNTPISFEQNQLSETVPIILDGITVPKYRKI
jgi:hypothetical protein